MTTSSASSLEECGTPSRILADLVELAAQYGPYEINFEDITGFTFDVPEFALPERHRAHCSSYCLFAKDHQGQRRECVINKRLCNRKAARGRGFSGMCHLGITECVEPLRVDGKTLGVFYFGSVVIKGREAEAERKVTAYCTRRRLHCEEYLERLKAVPRITEEEWECGRKHFRRMVRLAAAFVENAALPLDGYTVHGIRREVTKARKITSLTRAALAYVRKNYALSCKLKAAALALGCHPVHLSRVFKRDFGISFNEYLHRVRISHARVLLRTRSLNATQVSYEVGFSDPSHFNKTFQRLIGKTPAEFSRSFQA